MSVIPFLLIWKGEVIRSRSHFCNTLKDQHKNYEGTAKSSGWGIVISSAWYIKAYVFNAAAETTINIFLLFS